MKSLDKKKTKELDWEIELINSGKHLADILEQYNGNRQCKLCGAEPEKQSEWVIFLVKKLLTQQRTELLEEILNLECLKEENFLLEMSKLRVVIDNEHWNYARKFLKDTIEVRNQLRNEIKEEIKNV